MRNGRLEFDMKLILFILVFINYKLIYFKDLRKSYINEAFINSFTPIQTKLIYYQ